MPSVEICPRLGLKPTTPLKEAGRITEPLVCVPRAPRHMRSATAAPEPELEPPGVWAAFQGLCVLPASPMAKAVVTVLPSRIAPASRSRATESASRSAMRAG